MITEPKIENLLDKVENKYILVTLAARRTRQINEYLNSLNRPGVLRYRPPTIESLSSKPLTIALEEIAEGKVSYRKRTEDKPVKRRSKKSANGG